MKLYYTPQVCSLVVHAVLLELGIPFELEKFDLKTKMSPEGKALRDVSPKDYVPVLDLDPPNAGERLTELSVILRYLADQHPERKLAPPPGTFARVRFEELLHFLATELHKAFLAWTVIPGMSAESLAWLKSRLDARVAVLGEALGERQFLFGDSFTVVDAYGFWCLRGYSFLTKTKLEGALRDYLARMTAWPSIQAAVDYEKRH